MIITCPGCHTRFQIEPASLGDTGRTVRCSSCSERWFVEPFTSPAPPMPPAPRVDAPAKPSKGRSRVAPRGRLVAWLVAALVALLVAAALAARNVIASLLPAAAPVYQRLGLSLELPLLIELREVRSAERLSGGRRVLVVSGEISNISGQRRDVPPLRVAVLNSDRRELDFGLFDPPAPALGPGGSSRFEVEMGPPPPDASDLSVTFGETR
jgi:predicted Zn finger-like uncharacterized protein